MPVVLRRTPPDADEALRRPATDDHDQGCLDYSALLLLFYLETDDPGRVLSLLVVVTHGQFSRLSFFAEIRDLARLGIPRRLSAASAIRSTLG